MTAWVKVSVGVLIIFMSLIPSQRGSREEVGVIVDYVDQA